MAALLLGAVSAGAQGVEFDLLRGTDVVFLGEVHDNPHHHNTQVQAVVVLAPKAVVFEMLSPAQAARVRPELLDDATALEAALDWAQSGWPDFSMYYPIFAASEGARIYGAEVPRDQARAAIMGGDLDGVMRGAADAFGLDLPLPAPQQAQREALQLAAHCDALPQEMLPGMVIAQRLRDARLAQMATQALEDTGGPVVVITGNGHARTDWGAPSLLDPKIKTMSLGQFEAEPTTPQPYDMWLVTSQVARDDPCAAFTKRD